MEADYVCTERTESFLEHMGSSFSFHVTFQMRVKSNAGKL